MCPGEKMTPKPKKQNYTPTYPRDLALPISSNALRILLFLRLRCWSPDGPKARELTYADMRAAMPIGKDAISTAVRELVDAELVRATPRPGNRWRYVVVEQPEPAADLESATDAAPRSLGRARRKGQRFRTRQPLEPVDGEPDHEPGEPVDGNRVSRLDEPGEPVGRTASAARINRVSRSHQPGEPTSHSEPRSYSSCRSSGSKQADVALERDACLPMDPPSTKDDDTMQHDDVTECQPPSDRASRENGCLPADVDLEFPTAEELDAEGIVVDGIDFSDPPVLGDDEWMPPSEFDAPSDVVVDGFHLIDGEEPCEPSPEDLLDAVRGNVVSIDEARERRAAKAPGNAGGGRSCSAPVSRPSDG